jgi:isocitrate/isopropylmalate dehydrogenase
VDRALKIGILEGDDIGLEVVPEAIKVMRAAAQKAGLPMEWFPMPIGRKALDQLGYTLPPGTLEKLDTLDGWVLGPIGHQAYPKDRPNAINPHPILRKHYDLFANIRPQGPCPDCRRSTRTSISSSCARTTRGSRLTATPTWATASSARRPR